MTEIEIMRSRRRENTSAEAFGYVSQHRDMPRCCTLKVT